MLDLAWLRTFVAIYRSGSVTRAARQLGLSQPAISVHLRGLEAQVGRPLFVRNGRGMAATPAAHELARQVSPHLEALEAISLAAGRPAASTALSGTAHVGGPPDIVSLRVVPALAPLLDRGLRLRFHLDRRDEPERLVAAGELDAVITTGAPMSLPEIEHVPLVEMHWSLVASRACLARLGLAADAGAPWRLERLAQAPFVTFRDEMPRVQRYFAALGITGAPTDAALIVPDLRAVAAAVGAGVGLALLPRYIVGGAIARGELVEGPAPPNPVTTVLRLALRAGARARPAVAAIVDALCDAAPGWSEG